MRCVDLDYQRISQRGSWAEWVLLVTGIALSIEMTVSYVSLRQEFNKLEHTLANSKIAKPRDTRYTAAASFSANELARAQATINKIAIPWDSLFSSVETIREERITLLSLEPDPQLGTLKLTGEAHDFVSILTYISRLRDSKTLSNVYLSQHEIKYDEPNRPVFFSITAHWVIQP